MGGWFRGAQKACLLPAKSYNCACQGDTKDAGHRLALLPDRLARAAKPCARQSCHPAKYLDPVGREVSFLPHLSSFQVRILRLGSSRLSHDICWTSERRPR